MNTTTKERTQERVAQPAESKGEVATQERRASPAEILRQQMERQKPEFELVLPPGVSVDRFVRTIMTAVQADPDLMEADRKTLLQSAMQAAQDGLLPDKREGAFVIYNTKIKVDGKEAWIKAVQWMPMIRGIIKKAREGGEIATLSARVVYENDEFEYVLGDDERIEHKPTMGSRGNLVACYAIAKMKDGEVEREVMTSEDVAAVRSASRSKGGPWSGPFESEMWRKTVIRRLLKRLPMSTILEQIINRDDNQYEFKDQRGINWQARPAIDAPPPPKRTDFIESKVNDPHGAEDIDAEEEDHAGVSGNDAPADDAGATEREPGEDDADGSEDAAIAYTQEAIRQIGAFKSANAINTWFDTQFVNEAKKKGLSEAQFTVVEQRKIARVRELSDAPK